MSKMKMQEINAILYNNEFYIVGDLVSVTTFAKSVMSGRISKIGDYSFELDCSDKYKADIKQISFPTVVFVYRLKER